MSYIGATLYAPANLSIETFKERFEVIVQAVLDGNEPSAIGKGENIPGITLSIRSASLGTTAIEILEQGLNQFYPHHGVIVMVQEVGVREEVTLLPDFKERLDHAVETRKTLEEEAAQATKERVDRDAEQRRLNGMSIDELRSEGRYDEARIREEAESSYSTEPDYWT